MNVRPLTQEQWDVLWPRLNDRPRVGANKPPT